MRKRLLMMFLGVMGLLFLCTGCGNKKEETTTTTETAKKEKEDTSEKSTKKTKKQVKTAVLYIGKSGDYGRYTWPYQGELTPRKLIRGIEKTTGWNLTLNKRVTKREDGYIICFSEKSVLYTGQKNDEDDEFYIPYKEHFYQSVLDSIKKTIRYNLKQDGKKMNIYYWGKEDTPLAIQEIGMSVPMGEPYKELKTFGKNRTTGSDAASVYDVEGTFLGMKGEESIEMKVDGSKQIYRCTYRKLLPIFKASGSGRKMKIQITEDMITGERLVTKIY